MASSEGYVTTEDGVHHTARRQINVHANLPHISCVFGPPELAELWTGKIKKSALNSGSCKTPKHSTTCG